MKIGVCRKVFCTTSRLSRKEVEQFCFCGGVEVTRGVRWKYRKISLQTQSIHGVLLRAARHENTNENITDFHIGFLKNQPVSPPSRCSLAAALQQPSCEIRLLPGRCLPECFFLADLFGEYLADTKIKRRLRFPEALA